MSTDRKLVLAVAVGAVIVAIVAAAILSTLQRARTLTVAELRAGTEFSLEGVRFNQTGFDDLSHVDGPIRVTFRIDFPDGRVETLAFDFDGFCAIGAETRLSSAHSAPAAFFAHRCGEDFIRVWLE